MTRLLDDELTLEDMGQGRYRRLVSPGWYNSRGIVFGGYTAALSSLAAASSSPHPAISSGHFIFLNPVVPGHIDFEVISERIGRSAAAMRVVASQNDKQVLISQFWLRPAPTTTPPVETIPGWQGPDEGTPLRWLADLHQFEHWFESRGIDYPTSAETFHDGKRNVDAWVRSAAGAIPAGTKSQLFDILVADGHLGNGAPRGQPDHPAALVTMDLSIQWAPIPNRTGWRRIQAAASPISNEYALCTGTIFDETGAVCAAVAQQIMRVSRPAHS